MSLEIELKLNIAPQDIPALETHPLLHQMKIAETREKLSSIYFDTLEQTLRQHGFILRIRKHNNHSLLQTIKTSNKAINGLHQRQEWETPLQHLVPDFSQFPHPTLRTELLQGNLSQKIIPLFTTDFLRHNYRLQLAPQTQAMLSIDQGEITAGDLSLPISEIEIELVQGELQELLNLSDRLTKDISLTPEDIGKGGRGYQLASQFYGD